MRSSYGWFLSLHTSSVIVDLFCTCTAVIGECCIHMHARMDGLRVLLLEASTRQQVNTYLSCWQCIDRSNKKKSPSPWNTSGDSLFAWCEAWIIQLGLWSVFDNCPIPIFEFIRFIFLISWHCIIRIKKSTNLWLPYLIFYK